MSAAVEVANVSKAFGGLRAVDDVSLSVASGERRVLIGPNGAGKTTLFHCIAGAQRPTSGRIALFGTDISHRPESARTQLGLGRTFQISNVCADLTVEENIVLSMFGTDRRKWIMYRPVAAFDGLRREVGGLLEKVGLADRADERVSNLSYGEKRQLELGLALGSRPKVVLLDEPCAGLSPSERQQVFRLVSDLPRDVTLVMIEHDIDIALALADRVTVLHRGRVIFDGTPDHVRDEEEVREVYFGRL